MTSYFSGRKTQGINTLSPLLFPPSFQSLAGLPIGNPSRLQRARKPTDATQTNQLNGGESRVTVEVGRRSVQKFSGTFALTTSGSSFLLPDVGSWHRLSVLNYFNGFITGFSTSVFLSHYYKINFTYFSLLSKNDYYICGSIVFLLNIVVLSFILKILG